MSKPIDRESRENAIDVTVGANFRKFRLAANVSQTQIGEAIGVTFQQIQKYEKGTNRISASKLVLIAEHLGVKVSSFFENVEKAEGTEKMPHVVPVMMDTRTVRAMAEYSRLPERMRMAVNQIIRTLALEATPDETKAAA
ncbi:HTH-type transcriptional regulator protein [Rhizobium phage RHph_TM16]|nr:HTH-type transcriptional regulator protein [Rhizobium phage RHph_TM16]